jgi:hypothetical protein
MALPVMNENAMRPAVQQSGLALARRAISPFEWVGSFTQDFVDFRGIRGFFV